MVTFYNHRSGKEFEAPCEDWEDIEDYMAEHGMDMDVWEVYPDWYLLCDR